jgi:hypothetical protein
VATQLKGARIAVPLRKFRLTPADTRRAAVDMASIWERSKIRQGISALQMFGIRRETMPSVICSSLEIWVTSPAARGLRWSR